MASLSIRNMLMTFLVLALTSMVNAQYRVYRADTRSPDQIRAAGGFKPRGGQTVGGPTSDISMYNHARGAINGASRDDDGYVSTAADSMTAFLFLQDMFQGTGYIYTISAQANFINVAGTLGRHNPYPQEHEFAALGGTGWDTVISWRFISYGQEIVGRAGVNPDYNARRYNGGTPSRGEPVLAGFPNGHVAWTEEPWALLSNCPRPANSPAKRQSLHDRRTVEERASEEYDTSIEERASEEYDTSIEKRCNGRLTAFAAATKYMEEKCSAHRCQA